MEALGSAPMTLRAADTRANLNGDTCLFHVIWKFKVRSAKSKHESLINKTKVQKFEIIIITIITILIIIRIIKIIITVINTNNSTKISNHYYYYYYYYH
jgi:hypothetical protein